MRRFISAAAALIVMLLFVPSFTISASAAKNYAQGWDGNYEKSELIDNAGIFSSQQIESLNELIRICSQDTSQNIMVYVAGPGEFRSDYDTDIFADDSYDEIYGEDTDGVFFYMDFTGKKPAYDCFSTSGKASMVYGDHMNTILNDAGDHFPPSSVTDYKAYSDDIAEGVISFLNDLNFYNNSYRSSLGEYYRDDNTGKYFYYKHGKLYITKSKPPTMKLSAFIIAIFIGGLVTVIVYFTTKASYKFKASTSASVYVSKEEMERFGWQDQFIRSYQTRTRIESNSGGGGGRSHSGGGGRSHSGGHRTSGRHR